MKEATLLCCILVALFAIKTNAEKQIKLDDIERDTLANEKKARENKFSPPPTSLSYLPVDKNQYNAGGLSSQHFGLAQNIYTAQPQQYINDNSLSQGHQQQQYTYIQPQVQQYALPSYNIQQKVPQYAGIQYVMYLQPESSAYLTNLKSSNVQNYNLGDLLQSYVIPHVDSQQYSAHIYAQAQAQAQAQPQAFARENKQQLTQGITQAFTPATYATGHTYASASQTQQAYTPTYTTGHTQQNLFQPHIQTYATQVPTTGHIQSSTYSPTHTQAIFQQPQLQTYTVPATTHHHTQLLPVQPHLYSQSFQTAPQVTSSYNSVQHLPAQLNYAQYSDSSLLLNQNSLQYRKEPKSLLDSYVPSVLQLQYLKSSQQQQPSYNALAYSSPSKVYATGAKASASSNVINYQTGFVPIQGSEGSNYLNYRSVRKSEEAKKSS